MIVYLRFKYIDLSNKNEISFIWMSYRCYCRITFPLKPLLLIKLREIMSVQSLIHKQDKQDKPQRLDMDLYYKYQYGNPVFIYDRLDSTGARLAILFSGRNYG